MPDDPDKKRAEKKSDPTTSDPKPTRQTSLPPTSPIDSKKRTQGSTKPNQIPGPDASLLRKLSVKSTTSTPSSFAPIPGIRSKLDETKSPIEAVPTKPPQPRFNRPGFLGARGSPSSRGLRGRGRGGYTGRSYPYEYEPSEADTEATDGTSPSILHTMSLYLPHSRLPTPLPPQPPSTTPKPERTRQRHQRRRQARRTRRQRLGARPFKSFLERQHRHRESHLLRADRVRPARLSREFRTAGCINPRGMGKRRLIPGRLSR